MKNDEEKSEEEIIQSLWSKLNRVLRSEKKRKQPKSLKEQSWVELKNQFYAINRCFRAIGYLPFAITVKRGKGNSDLKDQVKLLDSVLNQLRIKYFRGNCSGVEFPILTFSGNAIDGSNNPHLHSLLFLPISLERAFEDVFVQYGISYRVQEMSDGKLIMKRKEIRLWKTVAKEFNSYFHYCARLEDEIKGKDLCKVIFSVSSFGFKSEGITDKKSQRIWKRIQEKFGNLENEKHLKIKIFTMLHFIARHKNSSRLLQEFIPARESDTETKRNQSLREITLDYYQRRLGVRLKKPVFRFRAKSKQKWLSKKDKIVFLRRDSNAVSVEKR